MATYGSSGEFNWGVRDPTTPSIWGAGAPNPYTRNPSSGGTGQFGPGGAWAGALDPNAQRAFGGPAMGGGNTGLMAGAGSSPLSQADYFSQNPKSGFGDYLNYAQGRTSASGAYLDPRNNPNVDTATLGDSRQFGSNTGRWNWDEGGSRWTPDVYQQPQSMGGILGSGFDWHNDIAPAAQFVGSALGGAATGNYAGLVGPTSQIAGNTSGGVRENVAGAGGSMPTYGTNSGSTNAGGGIPGLLGGAANLAGSNEALKAYEEAQRQAEAAGRFQPYNVFSGVGSTTFGPGGATSSLSPQYQGLRDQYLGNANAGAAAAGAFDPRQASNDLYGQLQAQAAPGEAEQRANTIAQLQGAGQLGLGVGADTGAGPANPLYSSLLKAQADAGRQRQISAYGMAQDTANQMQQRALGWGGAGLGLDQSQLQQQQLGLYGGGLQTNAALGGARLAQGPIMAQGLTKGGFLSGLGGALSGGPAGSNGVMTYLQRLLSGGGGGIPGLPGAPPNFNGTGVDQYGNPIGGNFSGGDSSQYNDLGGNWDPNTGLPYGSGGMSSFDPSTDWMNLYG